MSNKQTTAVNQAIKNLEQQRKALQEMDSLGVLLDGELTHKSNQINTIQLMLSKLLFLERKQIEDAYNQDLYGGLEGGKKFNDGLDYFISTFTNGE